MVGLISFVKIVNRKTYPLFKTYKRGYLIAFDMY